MRWQFAAGALALMIASGCARPAPPRPQPRTLPADSAALLARAVQLARPAFATQEEALRAGVYRRPPGLAGSETAGPAPAAPTAPAPGGGWVIQLAAFHERQQAERAAEEARRHFPAHTVVVETAGEVYRVALAGWGSAAAARAQLEGVQRIYPGAWIRVRGIS